MKATKLAGTDKVIQLLECCNDQYAGIFLGIIGINNYAGIIERIEVMLHYKTKLHIWFNINRFIIVGCVQRGWESKASSGANRMYQ